MIWILSLSLACEIGRSSSDEEVFDEAACRDVCVADPHPRWVWTEGCRDDGDCPAGSHCADGPARVPAAGTCAVEDLGCSDCGCDGLSVDCEQGPDERTCVLSRRSEYEPAALIDAFGSRTLTIDESYDAESGLVSVEWSLPGPADDYVVVACMLFGCPPAIRETAPSWDNISQVNYLQNYESCLLASAEFTGTAGVFYLGGAEYLYEPPGAGECVADVELPREVSHLLVGCLGYGDTEIRAASRLLPVDPAQISPEYSRLRPAEECLAAPAGTGCYRRGESDFGTCHAGVCHERCLSDVDCLSGDCLLEPFEYVGVCVEPSGDADTGGAGDSASR